MKKRDLAIVARLVADFLYFFGYLLLIPAVVGLIMAEYDQALVFGVGAVTIIPTFFVLRRKPCVGEVERRHAAITLAVAWTLFSLLSSLPFGVYGLAWVDALLDPVGDLPPRLVRLPGRHLAGPEGPESGY